MAVLTAFLVLASVALMFLLTDGAHGSRTLDAAVRGALAPRNAVRVRVSSLGSASYGHFRLAYEAAVRLDCPLLVSVPPGISLPRHWTTSLPEVQVLTVAEPAGLEIGGQRSEREIAIGGQGNCTSQVIPEEGS